MRDDAVIDDAAVVARLRRAGCVFAEEEAALLVSAARSREDLGVLVERRAAGESLEQVVGWAEFAGLTPANSDSCRRSPPRGVVPATSATEVTRAVAP